MKNKALANTLAYKLSKIKAKTLAKTLSYVDSKAVLDSMAHRLAELYVEKRADTLCDVKALAPVDVLPYKLGGKEKEILAATPGEMWKLTHWSTRWLTGEH